MDRHIDPTAIKEPLLPVNRERQLIELHCINMESSFEPRQLSLLEDACRENGMFSVRGHGIPPGLFEDMHQMASSFFSSSSEEKLLCFPLTSLGRKKKIQYKETVYGETLLVTSTPTEIFEESLVAEPALLSVMAEYLGQQVELYDRLIPLVLKSLGVGESMLSSKWSKQTTSMTIRYYYSESPHSMLPKFDEGRLSSILTMTFLGESRDLEIFSKGRWLSFNLSNAEDILISVGDQLQRFSEGKYKIGLHRIFTTSPARQMFIHVSFCAVEADTNDVEASTSGLEHLTIGSSDLEAGTPDVLQPSAMGSHLEPCTADLGKDLE